MRPLRVLVCGTGYGRTYLEAIRLGGARYHLAGILARGSPRSELAASEYGVPLYRSLDDLAPGIDLACAVIGAASFHLVLGLLERNIHVLCEHPQRSSCVHSALEFAASRGLCVHVNGHFADLRAAEAFVDHCRLENGIAPPCFFHVTCTDRSLYAALDILRRVLVSFAPFQFQVTSRLAPFTIVQGLLAGVPVTFHLQSRNDGRVLPDGSPAYLVDHRIVVGFRSGLLTLLSVNGPVAWNANMNSAVGPSPLLFTVTQEYSALTAALLYEQRIATNLAAVDAIVKNMQEGATPPEQAPNYLLDVSRAWEALSALL